MWPSLSFDLELCFVLFSLNHPLTDDKQADTKATLQYQEETAVHELSFARVLVYCTRVPLQLRSWRVQAIRVRAPAPSHTSVCPQFPHCSCMFT